MLEDALPRLVAEIEAGVRVARLQDIDNPQALEIVFEASSTSGQISGNTIEPGLAGGYAVQRSLSRVAERSVPEVVA